jgi:hypothetical protein
MLVIGFTTSYLKREAIFDHQTCDWPRCKRTIRKSSQKFHGERFERAEQAFTPSLAESSP